MKNTPFIEVSVLPEGAKPDERVDVSDVISALEYEDCEAKADKLSLTVLNHDLRFFDDPLFRKGNVLIVSWGYADAMAIPRRCQIRKVTGFKELKVEALGREVELNVETRTRSFEGMSRSDIAAQIAREWGFRDEELLHIQPTRAREHVTQSRMTDAQFLRRLAAKEGFEWYIDHDGFHFHERNLFQATARKLCWFDDPDTSEIQDISIENDVTRRAGSVGVKSHNPTQRRTIDVDASLLTEKQRAILGYVVEAPGKSEKSVPGFRSIAHHVAHGTTELDEDGAKRHAAATLRHAQQMAVKMQMTVQGDPNLQAKSIIEVAGVGKRLSQRYYVKTATHSISGAYTTKLECISDGSGGHATKSAHAHGLSAVNVGPKLSGKRVAPPSRRTLDVEPQSPGTLAPAAEPRPLVAKANSDGSTSFAKPSAGVPMVVSAPSSRDDLPT